MNKMLNDSPPRLNRGDLFAIIALALIVIAFFWRMVFTDLILPRGDVFTYFYPYWEYRNAALQMGRIPLWNPILFMGVPFLANSQAGVLYPPNWLLIPFDAPTAVKIALVTHLIWASTGTYLFARRIMRLSILSSTAAAITFTLGGYLTAQVEHVNQLQGLAWLPWLFLLWEEAQRNRWWMLWLGLALGMQLLAGHTQSAFISGIGLGLWAVWHSIGEWRDHPDRSPRTFPLLPLGLLAVASLIALGLAAVQLLPTAELTSLSYRSEGLTPLEAVSFSLNPLLIGRSMLPGYREASLFSEYVAYSGIAALILAVLGAWTYHRHWHIAGLIMLVGAGIFLALGAYNPIYWLLVRFVPGFDLFRAPARWLVLFAFSTAMLTGVGLDVLIRREVSRWGYVISGVVILILIALSPLAGFTTSSVLGASQPTLTEIAFWLCAIILTAALIVWSTRTSQYAPTALAALIALELFIAARSLPYNHLSSPAAWTTQRPAISTLLAQQEGQIVPSRFLSLSDTLFDPGDLREINTIYGQHLSPDALYDYIIATKQKEILAPNLPMAWGIPSMDGFDGGILPTRDYIRFTSLFLPEDQVAVDGRLREYLTTVPNPYWLYLTDTRYIITDKVYDAWIDGIYYDLQYASILSSRTSSSDVRLNPPYEVEATALGLVGHIEETSAVNGSEIGSLTITDSTNLVQTIPLIIHNGFVVAESELIPQTIGSFTANQEDVVEYQHIFSWQSPLKVVEIEVNLLQEFDGILILRGATLIDERSGVFVPVMVNPFIRIIHSGDVKIYESSFAASRVNIVCHSRSIVPSLDVLWERVARQEGITILDDDLPQEDQNCDPQQNTAVIRTYSAEQIIIDVEIPEEHQGGYLLLTDAYYPGWQATVDGEPTEVLRANGMFRAVRIPAGEHEVIFTYRSRPFEIGAIISGTTLLGVLIALVIMRPHKK